MNEGRGMNEELPRIFSGITLVERIDGLTPDRTEFVRERARSGTNRDGFEKFAGQDRSELELGLGNEQLSCRFTFEFIGWRIECGQSKSGYVRRESMHLRWW